MIIDRDKGYRRVIRTINALARGPAVEVGFFEEGPAGEGLTIVEIATVNEFGTEDGHVPERPFMRGTIDAHGARYTKELAGAVAHALDGADLESELETIGLGAVGDVQTTITELRDPPNAPSTIARKGSDNPLIDTGRMRASVRHRVVSS